MRSSAHPGLRCVTRGGADGVLPVVDGAEGSALPSVVGALGEVPVEGRGRSALDGTAEVAAEVAGAGGGAGVRLGAGGAGEQATTATSTATQACVATARHRLDRTGGSTPPTVGGGGPAGGQPDRTTRAGENPRQTGRCPAPAGQQAERNPLDWGGRAAAPRPPRRAPRHTAEGDP